MGDNKKTSEFELISRFFAPLTEGEPGAFGLSDDAACIPASHGSLVATTDTIVAGVHFPELTPAKLIAEKLLAVNLSDMAAMGAEPRAYLLSVSLPNDIDDVWLEQFSRSLSALQNTYNVVLIGGDTVSTPGPLTLTVCMLGAVDQGKALRRSGAIAGDVIYVSGTIGDAALGLLSLNDEIKNLAAAFRAELEGRYHSPKPRVNLGKRLFGIANAVTDISDGLVADLGHICKASSVAAVLHCHKTPLSKAGRAALECAPELLSNVISGGDDYELVFTAPPDAAQSLNRISKELNLPLTAIGNIMETTEHGKAVQVIDENGLEIQLPNKGYLHFA